MPADDLLLTGLVVACLPLCFWRPWIGVLLFTWLGHMNPHRLIGGVAYDLPMSKLVVIATLLGLVRTPQRAALPRTPAVVLMIALWGTFLCSTVLAARHPELAWRKFAEVSKILLMTGVTLVLFQERHKLHRLLVVIALSIGFFGAVGGVWGLSTGWPQILWGPPASAIADNNALGFALTMVLPFFVYLRDVQQRWWMRHVWLALFGLSVIAVYATYSRGAFVGLCVVFAVLLVKRGLRDRALLVVMALTIAAVALGPSPWTARMKTITPQAPRVDSSGRRRLGSWYAALRLGLDHPVLGAGFWPFDPEVYGRYIPGSRDYHDAHTHFLQVFAEHGFPGLLLFCALLGCTLHSLHRVRRAVRGDPQRQWLLSYADLVEVSLIAYLAGGVFLNMPYFDLLYQLIAVAIILDQFAGKDDVAARLVPRRTEPGVDGGDAAAPVVRVLVLSHVFPSTVRPRFGVFVEERVRHLTSYCQLEVVSPFPWFPLNAWFRGSNAARPPAFEERHGLTVHHPRVFSPPGWGKSLDGALFALRLLPFLVRLRRRFRFDLIDAHFGYPDGVAAALLAKALGCPVCLTLRGDEARLADLPSRRIQLRWALRAARVIAVGESLRQLACDLGVPADQVRVIGNGVDPTRFHPGDQHAARTILDLPHDRPVILAVGSLTEAKGHQRIVEILPDVRRRHPAVLLVIVGTNPGRGSWHGPLTDLVRRLHLEDHVRLAGERPHAEIPLWMAAADLFCLATGSEGCCNAIIEALACGLPVVTTDVGGNPQLVRDGLDGFLVPFWDATAFRAAVVAALDREWDGAAIAAHGGGRPWDDVAREVCDEFRAALRDA